jgi:hypothetical protein
LKTVAQIHGPTRLDLKALARQHGIPYATLMGWLQTGKIKLPGDLALLKRLRRGQNGRWYVQD